MRIGFLQRRDDCGLGCLVNFGNEIVRLLRADLEQIEVVGGAVDDLAGAARRLDGDIQGWMHGLKELSGRLTLPE